MREAEGTNENEIDPEEAARLAEELGISGDDLNLQPKPSDLALITPDA